MRIKTYKYVAAISMAILTVFCLQSLAYGLNVADRTPQVRDAIVAAAGVDTPGEVTEAHLAAITALDLASKNITTLKIGDFDGLTSLQALFLNNNQLTDLPAFLFIRYPEGTARTPTAFLSTVFNGLTSLRHLYLNNNRLTFLREAVFSGLTSLEHLYLHNNTVDPLEMTVSLEKVAADAFRAVAPTGAPFDMRLPIRITNGSIVGGATALTIPQGSIESETFTVTQTPGSSLAVTVDIEALPEPPHQGYALVKPEAPPLVVLPNAAPVFSEGATATRTIAENTPSGTNIGTPVAATDANNDILTYTLGGTDAASFRIVSYNGQLRTHAALDYQTKEAYSVTVSVSDGNGGTDSITVTINVTDVNEVPTNSAPVFTDGDSTTRSIAENTAAGTDIGTPVAATDADNDTLTYSLGGVDAASFNIISASGQLQTSAALDFETKDTYTVTVSVSDGNGGSDSITVTITVTDVPETLANNAPVFTEGSTTTRAVAENTAAGVNIGTPVAATDADNDTLTYSLAGDDAAAFSIVSTSGQLQTSAALDYETKNAYLVTVSVSDGNGGSDSIDVTINVTDVNDPPSFIEGSSTTRRVAGNTASGQNIGDAIAATDPDAGDTLTYTLGGTDAAAFSIVSASGQLQTSAALDREVKSSYLVTVSVSDGNGGTDSITVTINVTNVAENSAPVFTGGDSTTRSIAENTAAGTDIGTPVAATDADNDTLTYSLGGVDAASFNIISASGQLQTSAALDFETKDTYTVTVSVSDGNGGTDSITVTINVTDVAENSAPVFTGGDSTTRSVAENTASGTDIGTPVAATDADNDTLTYSLGGVDAASFNIISASGQLQTSAALDFETKDTYTVTVSVSDGNGGTDSITVTINITDVNETPVPATNNVPVFTEGSSTTRSVAENTPAGQNIGAAVTATDADNDTLTYSLGGTNASSFSIINTSGQLQTSAPLDFETQSTYTVSVSVSDGNGGTDSIDVTINVTDVNDAPVFTDGTSTTRSVGEGATSGTNIGSAVAATDVDNDTLTYTLGGADAADFSIVDTSGQLQTSATLDYETETEYAVSVSVSDGNGGTASIAVTIDVNNTVDEPPEFTEGTSTTRSVIENTPSGVNIGDPVSAIANAGDTLTYSLGGDDAASFSINDASGQLQTSAALDYETKTSYEVTVSVSDDDNDTDSITVTINVTDVDESITPVANRTWQVRDAIVAAVSGVDSADDVTPAHLAAITLLNIARKNITSLKSGDFSGLTSLTHLDMNSNSISDISPLENLTSLTSLALGTNSISDISPLGRLTNLTLLTVQNNPLISDMSVIANLTNLRTLSLASNPLISDISAVEDLTSLTSLNMDNNSISDISAVENLTSLTNLELGNNSIEDISAVDGLTNLFILGLSDNSIKHLSGLENLTAMQFLYLRGNPIASYAPLRELITKIGQRDPGLTLDITVPQNNPPVFSEGASTTRSIAENTDASTNIGAAVAATDPNTRNILTYSLSGTDQASFDIVSTSGQLQTKAALDFETKNSYTVTVSVSDGDGGSDSITVTITVTNVNEAPSFASSTETRSIAENTASGQNIGAAVTATDVDDTSLTYTLGGDDADAFDIGSTSGQLQTKDALDHETKASYSVTVTATDAGNLSDTTTVTITVTNVNEAPTFADGTSISDISATAGTAITSVTLPVASDPESDSITYTLTPDPPDDLTFTASTRILAGTPRAEAASAIYTYTAKDDGNLSSTLTFKIEVSAANNNPVFTDGTSTTRSVAENTASGQNIGAAVAATDADNDTLTYSLGGTDQASFGIDTASGQLQTSAALDRETKASYSVTVDVSDGNGGSDSIDVTINVSDVNEAPTFASSTETRSVAENTASGQNIGAAVTATDVDDTSLTYTLGGDDADAFDIGSTSGQLQTSDALDHETDDSYTVTVTATDAGNLSDTTAVTITVTNVNEAPTFADGTSISNISATKDTAITSVTLPEASDPESDSITYTLTPEELPDGLTFTASTRELAGTPRVEAASTTYTYTAKDAENLSSTLTFTIQVSAANNDPVFTDGASTTRSVAENTASGQNIGTAVAATDADSGDTLTYSLSGDDADSFDIDSTSGQLQTKDALDHETTASYSVTVGVSDGNGGTDSIDVTINVTDVNEAPTFASSTATRSIAENTASGQNIGAVVTATDVDDASLTYTLGGTDAASFDIGSTSGQLQTSVALDHETKASYSVTVTATDAGNLADTTTVTITVTNVNEAPTFASGTSISDISATKDTAITSVTLPEASDPESDSITYTLTPEELPDGLTFTASTRELAGTPRVEAASTTYTYKASDGNLSSTLTFKIEVVAPTATNNTPVFTDGTSTTRSVNENTAANTNIGTAVGANDADGDTLTYSLGGDDAGDFKIASTTGQLQTKASLNHEDDDEYEVTVSVSDGNGGSASIDVTINVTDVNELPVFSSDRTTRSVAENTASGTNIGTAIVATDPDDGDTLTYELFRGDKDSFSVTSTGQLQTKVALDYETKDTYDDLLLSAEDEDGLFAAILLTINVTNVNEAPTFADGTSISDISATTNTALSVTLPVASDPESDSITYTLTPELPAGLTFTDSTRVLDGTPTAESASATYTYTAKDAENLSSTLTFKIEVVAPTPTNNNPVFTDGASTTRDVAENTASGQDIGTAVGATDADNDTLTYTLGGTDADSFGIVGTSGQLQTNAALNHEDDDEYEVTVSVSDGNGGSASIDVTINVTDVNEKPRFSGSRNVTLSVRADAVIGTNVGAAFQAIDPEGDTLTYSLPPGRGDASSFTIDASTGQLKTAVAMDGGPYDDLAVRATDPNGLFDAILVTVNVTSGNQRAAAAPSVPSKTALLPNFPNPFNPETWIPYQLAKPAKVTLTIYNIRGVVVRKLKLGHQPAGVYRSRSRAIHWNGRNEFGEQVAAGVYFYTLTTGNFNATRIMLICK